MPRRERQPRALAWATSGLSRGLRHVWRAAARRRPHRRQQQQHMPMPLASLSSTMLLHSQHQEAPVGQVDCGEPLFLLPQLPPLPAWLTSTLAGAGAGPAQQQQPPPQQQALPAAAAEVEAVDAGPLEHMLNPRHTFAMTLTPLGPEAQQQAPGSSSSRLGGLRPQQHSNASAGAPQQQQQLLTVGSRHWGVRGLLSVRLYDFALYMDSMQAQAVLPAVAQPSMQEAHAASHQQQQQQQPEAPQQHRHHQRWGGGWLSEVMAVLAPMPWAPAQQLEQQQRHGGGGSPAAAADVAAQQQQLHSPGELLPVLQQLSRREARQRAKQARRQSKQARQQERRAAKEAAAAAKAASKRAAAQAAAPDLPGLVKAGGSGVPMCLVLKAAREVPLHLLADEYEKVLARRLAAVGGGPADAAALRQLLAAFSRPEALPAAVRARGGSVAPGAMIVFERGADSSVVARVGAARLASVPSCPRLAEALFDLYLGNPPASVPARAAAAATLARMAAAKAAAAAAAASEPAAGGSEGAQQQQQQQQQQQLALAPHYLPQGRHESISCSDGPCVRGGDASGMALRDLAACTLHMG